MEEDMRRSGGRGSEEEGRDGTRGQGCSSQAAEANVRPIEGRPPSNHPGCACSYHEACEV